jgi:3-isopropylmalate/(R)-2-methylmalate dehydratase small subunit
MEPVTKISGPISVLRRNDVDTDQIIPKQFLKRVERTGFGEGLFSAWKQDPDFVLNDPRYREAQVLVTGPNFGTGSSREHAVWALQDFGFRAVISPRFADIFRTNCTKVGLVPVQVETDVAEALMTAVEADPELVVTVDVEARMVWAEAAGIEAPFPLDDFTPMRLLEGLDDVGLTLRHTGAIDSFEATRPAWLPTTSS